MLQKLLEGFMYATYTRIKSTTGYNVGAFCDNLPKSTLSFLAIPTTDTENTQRYDVGEARERKYLAIKIIMEVHVYVQKACSNKQIESW